MQSFKKRKSYRELSWSQRQEDQEFDILNYIVRAARDTCGVTGVFPRD